MKNILIFIILLFGYTLFSQTPTINIRGKSRIVYGGDTCDTYFSGDTLIINSPTVGTIRFSPQQAKFLRILANSINVNDSIGINGDYISSWSEVFNDSASYSDTSGYAVGSATSDSAIYADTAGYALNVVSSDSALWADTSGYVTDTSVLKEGNLGLLDTCDIEVASINANDSIGVGGVYIDSWTELPNIDADSALHADSALWADTAGYALNVAVVSDSIFNKIKTGYTNDTIVIDSLFNQYNEGSLVLRTTRNGFIEQKNPLYNTSVGDSSLFSNTTGIGNSAFGMWSLRDNTVGGNNTALGVASLVYNIEGNGNTGIGSCALEYTVGSYNTAIGYLSLFDNINGEYNTALGNESLINCIGSNNIGIGAYAGKNHLSDSNWIYINSLNRGNLLSDDTSKSPIAIKQRTNIANQEIYLNGKTHVKENLYVPKIVIGDPLTGDTTTIDKTGRIQINGTAGLGNINISYNGLRDLISGQKNTILGYQIAANFENASYNTAIGDLAMMWNVSGNYNTAIGYESINHILGSNNIGIGYHSGDQLSNHSNRLIINSLDRNDLAGDTTKSIIYGYQAEDTTKQKLYLNAKTRISGDLTYNFIHAVGSADSVAYNTGTTQNVYYKIGAGITWREADGITCAGDSARILTAGDYKIHVWLAATSSNANDKLRVKMYVNGSPLATSLGRFVINSNGTGNAETNYYMWYKTMSVNDYISIRITNQTGARACDISDIKVYIEKVPEN